jgi:ankyrin repeat protein
MPTSHAKMEARQVLERYRAEDILEFVECELIDVNQKGNDGSTPLHVACQRNSLEEARALIEGGADVNAVGDMWTRPLHIAARVSDPDIVGLLIESGAARNVYDHFRDTPLMRGNGDIVALIERAHEE